MMAAVTRWERDPEVLGTELHDEVVLLHPTTQAMFSLNATALVVWNTLAAPADLDHLVAAVTDAFAVDADTAADDVRGLLAELVAAGLVHER